MGELLEVFLKLELLPPFAAGAAGLVGVAWFFWHRSPRIATFCLVAGVVSGVGTIVLILILTIGKLVYELPPSYTVQVEPSLQDTKWGGIDDTGKSIRPITLKVVRNETAVGDPRKIDGVDIAARELRAEIDPENTKRMRVNTIKKQVQGHIYFEHLARDLRERIFSGTSQPFAIAYTEKVGPESGVIGVSEDSAVQEVFQSVTMKITGWNYDPNDVGVWLDVYIGDVPVQWGVVSRQRAMVISAPMKLIIGLLGLDLTEPSSELDLKEPPRKYARFVLLKYL